eukprot:gene3870-4823_t
MYLVLIHLSPSDTLYQLQGLSTLYMYLYNLNDTMIQKKVKSQSNQPTTLFTFGGDNLDTFVTVNLTTGELTSIPTPDFDFNIDSFLYADTESNNLLFLVTQYGSSRSSDADNIYEYNIKTNQFTQVTHSTGSIGVSMIEQQYGFDPYNMLTMVCGGSGSQSAPNVTIALWDFVGGQKTLYTLPDYIDFGLLNAWPEGAYDPELGIYYVLYFTKSNFKIKAFDTKSRTVVEEFTLQNIGKIIYPSLIFANNQLYLMNSQFFGPTYDLYSINLMDNGQLSPLKKIFSIPTSLTTAYSIDPYTVNGNTIVFITSPGPNKFTLTTLYLPTMTSTSVTTSKPFPKQIQYTGLF